MNNIDKSCDALSPKEMIKVAENACIHKTKKKSIMTLFSAITAGIFISIGFVFYITVTTDTVNISYGITKLIGGVCFSMGLMLVLCSGGDLFTSTVLTIIPKATNKITYKQMLFNWILVYSGNFIGATLFVIVIWYAGQHTAIEGSWGLNALKTANHKLHHSFIEALCLGILANLMVCLATWMSYAGRSLLDKMVIMILPIAMFVASGFEHSIANMFIVPMGIIIHNFADTSFWTAINSSPDAFAGLTWCTFIFKNLIPVTIGNIIGGLAVGLTYWALYLRKYH